MKYLFLLMISISAFGEEFRLTPSEPYDKFIFQGQGQTATIIFLKDGSELLRKETRWTHSESRITPKVCQGHGRYSRACERAQMEGPDRMVTDSFLDANVSLIRYANFFDPAMSGILRIGNKTFNAANVSERKW